MKHLLIALITILTITSCNNPKQRIKQSAITFLKENNTESIRINSIDSLNTISIAHNKELAKAMLDTIRSIENKANLREYIIRAGFTNNPKVMNNLSSISAMISENALHKKSEMLNFYSKIQAYKKDTAAYIYKIVYNDNNTIFAYCSTDFKQIKCSKEKSNEIVFGKEFMDYWRDFGDSGFYLVKMYSDYLNLLNSPLNLLD